MVIKPFRFELFNGVMIYGYGIAIFVGLVIAIFFAQRRLKSNLNLSFDETCIIFFRAIIVGLLGGRLLYILTDYNYESFWDSLNLWRGGFSILGTVIFVTGYLVYTLKKRKIPILNFLDVIGMFAPIAHFFGRLGCLWAGCCFGVETKWFLNVIYKGVTAGAPVGVWLVPVQLYSALSFLFLFFLIYFFIVPYFKKPGIVFLFYLMGLCIERFLMDFLRADRSMSFKGIFSFYQWLSLGLLGVVVLALIFLYRKK